MQLQAFFLIQWYLLVWNNIHIDNSWLTEALSYICMVYKSIQILYETSDRANFGDENHHIIFYDIMGLEVLFYGVIRCRITISRYSVCITLMALVVTCASIRKADRNHVVWNVFLRIWAHKLMLAQIDYNPMLPGKGIVLVNAIIYRCFSAKKM